MLIRLLSIIFLLSSAPFHALANDGATAPSTYRGVLAGSGGLFARGTITFNDKAIICEVQRVFREDTTGFKYRDIDAFSTSIGLFRGRVMLNMTDGRVVTLSAPQGSARAMKSALASRLLSGSEQSAQRKD